MSNILKMLSRGGAAAADTDPNFNQTVLLLHGDGTNGAQNNTFLDSSTNNFTITRNGNTTQGTFSPFSVGAGEWSNFFDGTGDRLTLSSNTSLSFGTGDWTIEFWIYRTDTNESIVYEGRSTEPQVAPHVQINPSGVVLFYVNGAARITGTTVIANGWYHIAVSKLSGSTRLFVNGVQEGSTYSDSNNYTIGATVYIGGDYLGSANAYMNGYLSNLRVLKGTGYSSITVPTAPLTAITNTSLLTCQSNRFVDNSTNAFAITRNGDVRVTPFSPFAPSAAYSSGTNGGSGYFDGTGDWLTPPNDVALDLTSGDFTVSFWIYRLNDSRKEVWFTPKGFTVYFDGGSFIWTGSTALSLGTVNINSWNHIQVVKSGSTLYSFVNGVVTNHGTRTLNNGAAPQIGAEANASPFTGYISGLRVVKGTALNTTSFTPPTEPPTAITNTALLCNFTNAGIFDNTGKNNLETVGNAQIDTTTKKYGTGSMEFDGTDDRLVMPSNPELNLSSGNFTIEAWVYWTGSNANAKLLSKDGASGSSYAQYNLGMNGSGYISASVGSGNGVGYFQAITSNTLLPTNQWVHIAFVKNGTNLSLYQNGTSVASATQSGTMVDGAKPLLIGYETGQAASNYWNGFIDDLRITKGVARYTANFTAPTKAFPDQ
jgi:hypothetical protein